MSLPKTKPRAPLRVAAMLVLLAFSSVTFGNGSDLPPEIVLNGYVRQDADRVQLVVRIPLVLLATFAFPKRGPGYLDLARIDDKLQEAAAATGRQIELAADDTPLKWTVVKARVSRLSDRSFASYPAAVAHVEGPPLPVDTDLFWSQGFFDTELAYAAPSASRLAVRVNVAPELGRRLKLQLQYLPPTGAARTYELPGGTGWVPLSPRWFEAARMFVVSGIANAFAPDRFVFLLCLIAPFTRFGGLLAVVLVMAAMQALTLTGVAEGAVAGRPWLPAIVASTLYVVTLLLAIGNLGSPSLRRRWFIAAVIGSLAGFGLGNVLASQFQFAGDHTVVSAWSFNVGVAIGDVIVLAIAFVALRALFATMFGATVGVIIVSALAGLLAWDWTTDANHELAHELGHALSEGFVRALPIVLWMLPAVVVGVLAYWMPRGFGGVRVATLRDALLGRVGERGRAVD